MRKIVICLALMLGVVLEADAQKRSMHEMTDIAVQAMQSANRQPVYSTSVKQQQPKLTVAMSSPELAVFNSSRGGWVIVSAYVFGSFPKYMQIFI